MRMPWRSWTRTGKQFVTRRHSSTNFLIKSWSNCSKKARRPAAKPTMSKQPNFGRPGEWNGKNGKNGHKKQNGHSDWGTNLRWSGITRPYSYEDVLRLRGTIQIEYTLARLGAERLWNLMHTDAYVAALGAVTGNQAIEMVQAGLNALYGS